MSAAEDVIEMKTLSNELADRLVGIGAQVQVRVGAVLRAINAGAKEPITGNRAYEFLNGRARMVHTWETTNAKRQLRELKERERLARENEHLAWLECEIARHRASGSEFRGPHVDGLEHFLRLARGADGTVALSEADTETTGD
jgi:hypothetical protein